MWTRVIKNHNKTELAAYKYNNDNTRTNKNNAGLFVNVTAVINKPLWLSIINNVFKKLAN